MAQIKLFQRQGSVPTSTGVPMAQAVPVQSDIGNALGALGGDFVALGNTLAVAADNQAVSEAQKAATLQLQDLTTEMSKKDGPSALLEFDQRATDIHANVTKGMGKRALDAFNINWNTLTTASQIKVKSAGVARWHDQMKGNLTVGLDTAAKIASNPAINVLDRERVFADAQLDIDEAVRLRVITVDEGAKRMVKFQHTVAKQTIAGWKNSATKGDLLGIYNQMDTGAFDNPAVAKQWRKLTEIEKETFRTQTARELSHLQTLADKQDRKVEKALKRSQEDATASLMTIINAVSLGEMDANDPSVPTLPQLEALKKKRTISGDHQIQLMAALLSTREAKTSPETIMELSSDIDAIAELPEAEQDDAFKAVRQHMNALIAMGRLDANGTKIMLTKMKDVRSAEFKTSAKYLAKKSLGRVLGVQDEGFRIPGMPKLDAMAAARAQFALNEYDARIAAGDDPWAVHNDLIVRARIKLPKMNSFLRPQLGSQKPLAKWTDAEIQEAQLASIAALRAKQMTPGAFKSNIDNIAMIKRMLDLHRQKAIDDEEAEKEGNDRANAAAPSTPNEPGFVDRVQNFFGGGDNRISLPIPPPLKKPTPTSEVERRSIK